MVTYCQWTARGYLGREGRPDLLWDVEEYRHLLDRRQLSWHIMSPADGPPRCEHSYLGMSSEYQKGSVILKSRHICGSWPYHKAIRP
jgi:hypothetical protein